MHRRTYSETGDGPSPRSSRASFSSDRNSVAGSVTFQMPSTARPPPAYIAPSVASQIVTDHHNAQLRLEAVADADVSLLTNAVFSEQALGLLNGFLDNLLFAFLAAARSPSLAAIRPAINEVLKPRLAREATATADDELQGLLGGDEEDFPEPEGPAADVFDVEKVWKRTRLRVMVYTRLGELEDEDEERYVRQERRLSMHLGGYDDDDLVSWASAIFLTSVLEYVAEQTLLISGVASYNRMAARLMKLARNRDSVDPLERIVVEEYDVEKIALNSALGRLWRTWRKRTRGPVTPLGVRPVTSYSSLHSRQMSIDLTEKASTTSDSVQELEEHKPDAAEVAASIPLPIRDNDVDEIEVPGLAANTDDEDETDGADTPVARPKRPTSVIVLSPAAMFRKRRGRERPISMPPPTRQPFIVAPAKDTAESDGEEIYATPMETLDKFSSDDDSFIVDEVQETIHNDRGDVTHDADMMAFAASTGLGLIMTPQTPMQAGFGKEKDEKPEGMPSVSSPGRIMPTRRVSIQRPGPPGVVRTRSVHSSQSTPSTPNEPTSFFHDAQSDDEASTPHANGAARTSKPLPTIPSPSTHLSSPMRASGPAQEMQPDHQGFVELTPRQTGTTMAQPVRAAPEAVEQSRSLQNAIGEQSVRGTEPQRREITPPKGRVPVLEALHEVDDVPSSPPKRISPRKQSFEAPRTISASSSPRIGVGRHREAPLPLSERPLKRPSGSPPLSRDSASDLNISERTALNRVSSASTSKSASTSILNVGRDSESSLHRPRGLSRRMSEEDREREFVSLLRSDETVKVSLTPRAMRDMDEPTFVRPVEKPRPSTSSIRSRPRVSTDKDHQLVLQPVSPRSASLNNGLSSPRRPASNNSSGPKRLAREPRIQGESIKDFADFIRTTGPSPGAEKPVQPFVPLAGTPTPPPGLTTTIVGGVSKPVSSRQASGQSAVSKQGPPTRSRSSMEPRSPAAQRVGQDDLIDFIRQGPPVPNGNRIPRAVAPFRTTIDSDQFDEILDGNSNIESAYSSQISSLSKNSANSRTGLLPSPSTVQPAYSTAPHHLTGSLAQPEPQSERTRYRNKDPYAIPDSDDEYEDDEDDDLLTALPRSRPQQRQERQESLADFLLSADPPPSNTPQPLRLSPATLAAAKAKAAATHSAGHTALASPTNGSYGPQSPLSPKRTGSRGAQQRPESPPQPNRVPQGFKPRLAARSAAAARDSVAAHSATSDLADFLRNSGPPEPPVRREAPTQKDEGKKEGKRGAARFWRKKTEVA